MKAILKKYLTFNNLANLLGALSGLTSIAIEQGIIHGSEQVKWAGFFIAAVTFFININKNEKELI